MSGDTSMFSDGCASSGFAFGSAQNLQFFENLWEFAYSVGCGSGQIDAGETCDDGNTVNETECPYGTPNCTACSSDCMTILTLTGSYCGDGVLAPPEACDEGTDNSDDNPGGCGTDCTINSGAAGAGGTGAAGATGGSGGSGNSHARGGTSGAEAASSGHGGEAKSSDLRPGASRGNVSGGCGCRASGTGESRDGVAALVLALGAVLFGQRWRSRRVVRSAHRRRGC